MDAPGSALGTYLRARRRLITPESAGLPREPGRRVHGLTREEVAELARISPAYYTRLEQGRGGHPSMQVLRAIAEALELDGFAVEYMSRLSSRESSTIRDRTASGRAEVDPTLVALLDQWPQNPAIVADPNQDIAASNSLARSLGTRGFAIGLNLLVLAFSPQVRAIQPEWEDTVNELVAAFRYHGDPRDPRFTQILATLTVSAAEFPEIWARHDARPFTERMIRVPVTGVGLVDLNSQRFAVPDRPGWEVGVMFAPPGSEAAVRLAVLAERAP